MDSKEQKADDMNLTEYQKKGLEHKQKLFDQGLVAMTTNNYESYVSVRIDTPEGQKRNPQDIVAVIDISGSMAQEALIKNKDGIKESNGLAYLDLLKHSIKTIIHSLNENDRFGLVSYSDDARLESKLKYMDSESKQQCLAVLDNLQPEGTTNIWAGLLIGLDELRVDQQPGIHQTIMLLTDGDPNIYPPKGFIPSLDDYKKKHNFEPTINTYAFGKAIDSVLLNDYSQHSGGSFTFIPCPGFAGTIFVNSIANILSTMASNCQIYVEMQNGIRIEQVLGGFLTEISSKKKKIIKLGNLQFGSGNAVLLKLKYPDTFKDDMALMNIKLSYYDYRAQQEINAEIKEQKKKNYTDPLFQWHYCRLTFIDKVREANEKMRITDDHQNNAIEVVKNLIEEFKKIDNKLEDDGDDYDDKNDQWQVKKVQIARKYIAGIIKDLEKEVTLAFAKTFSYHHWGKHYLPSLTFAHQRQQCNNFCDPGVQNYGGGQVFSELKDSIEQIFIKLPPPKKFKKKEEEKDEAPKRVNKNSEQWTSLPPQRQPSPEDMSAYYDAGGGCFAENCLITLSNNQKKKIKDIKKGDLVKNVDGSINRVSLLVKILCGTRKIQLVQLKGGLLITPKHPVRINGEWKKPGEIGEIRQFNCQAVYNLVLESGHCVNVNGIECSTLGHGFKGKNVEHEYFGSQKIISDLKKIGNKEGIVYVDNEQFIRDKYSQSVTGLRLIE